MNALLYSPPSSLKETPDDAINFISILFDKQQIHVYMHMYMYVCIEFVTAQTYMYPYIHFITMVQSCITFLFSLQHVCLQ